ncbi:recombinase RarA, partial [Levilactobacillus parabrevis]|nr:recombinase RarA [Levilactobacillus parabrevis]
LNGLELAAQSTPPGDDDHIHITLEVAEACFQRRALVGDKNGDAHYDVISAFQKSIRGSDTDAALHYLGQLVAAGDLPSICRRLMVIAYEDIGMANLPAAARTVQAVTAAQQLGLPEGRIPLADAVIELCLSPKSNSGITAMDEALEDVMNGHNGAVPDRLKDAHYVGAKKLGHGTAYQFPHDFPNDWVKQQYLPDTLRDAQYYHPKTNGRFESQLAEQYERLRRANRT